MRNGYGKANKIDVGNKAREVNKVVSIGNMLLDEK